jgi:peptidoglycan/LPS O-acetylase OafA/YrhL
MTSHPSTNLKRIEAFESLRGLMAFWVIIGHVLLTFTIPRLENNYLWMFFSQNGRAVNVFMILSGFVIFYLLHSKNEDYLTYLTRRFLRIFPVYLLCLLFSACMLPMALEAMAAFANSPRNLGRVAYLSSSLEFFVPHFAAHLTMLHGVIPSTLLPHSNIAILGQAWSISVEWQFYLVAPLAFALLRNKTRWLGWTVLAVLLFLLTILGRKIGEGFIGKHLIFFIIGCASAIYWFRALRWHRLILAHSDLSIPLIALLCCLLMPSEWEIGLWAMVFLSALAIRDQQENARIAGLLLKILHWSPLRYFGKISYSMYLVHMIPLFVTLWLFKDYAIAQEDLLLVTMMSTLGVTCVLSAVMYRWVEVPFIELGRTIRLPRWVDPIARKQDVRIPD